MKQELEFIKSPLNYTGNKYRILNQITPCFPEKVDCMIDLFCGGATVGLNTKAKKVIFVDNNERVINLLIYLSKISFECFLKECERIIEEYNLSYSYKNGYKFYRNYSKNKNDNNGLKDYNYDGFYKLRNDYNKLDNKNSDEANIKLYMLMVYGFNNDIRFNQEGEYNLPVGKTDLNKQNIEKVKAYITRVSNMEVEFLCLNFNDEKFKDIVDCADFIYMDPPYLLGDAVYNSVWNNKKEHELLDFINDLLNKKKNFALSNVLQKVGKINEPLAYWIHKNDDKINVKNIEYHYRSASYHKIDRNAKEQEILIYNKEYENENK